MRPDVQQLHRLALATLLILLLQCGYDQISVPVRFYWPIRWYSLDNGAGRVLSDGPRDTATAGRTGSSVQIRGAIAQRAELLHGARRPVRISLEYRAPHGGAWIALAGDALKKPMAELFIRALPSLPTPGLPGLDGLYRIPLPTATSWTSLTLLVQEHTDIPYLTLALGGARPECQFASVHMTYADDPSESLLDNGDFREGWPGWAVHPVWINPIYVPWPPARTMLVLVLGAGLLLGWKLWRNEGHAPRPLVGIVWIGLSALLILGSQLFPDMADLAVLGHPGSMLRVPTALLAWALQLGLFAYAGWVGGRLLGPSARFWTPLITFLACVLLTSTVEIGPQTGLPSPFVNTQQFLEGIGPFWVILGIAAAWRGSLLAQNYAWRFPCIGVAGGSSGSSIDGQPPARSATA